MEEVLVRTWRAKARRSCCRNFKVRGAKFSMFLWLCVMKYV